MRRRVQKSRVIVWAALLAVFLLSMSVGRYPLSPGEILLAILRRITGHDYGIRAEAVSVVMDSRLSRAVSGAFAGAALAASGCALQGLFRNPLVSQGVLGVSSGAGFGAALSVLLFSGTAFAPGFAFLFGISAVGLSFLVAHVCGEATVLPPLRCANVHGRHGGVQPGAGCAENESRGGGGGYLRHRRGGMYIGDHRTENIGSESGS